MSSYKNIVKKDKSLLITPMYNSPLLEERTLTIGTKISVNDSFIVLDKQELRNVIFYLMSIL